MNMLCGRLTRIVVKVQMQPINEILHGNYFNDKLFKRRFQLWQEKDRLLDN